MEIFRFCFWFCRNLSWYNFVKFYLLHKSIIWYIMVALQDQIGFLTFVSNRITLFHIMMLSVFCYGIPWKMPSSPTFVLTWWARTFAFLITTMMFQGLFWNPKKMLSSPMFVLTWQPRTIEFLIFLLGRYEDAEKLLILCCRFDNNGASTCFQRFPDPSFFKMAHSRLELMKPEIFKEKTMLQ